MSWVFFPLDSWICKRHHETSSGMKSDWWWQTPDVREAQSMWMWQWCLSLEDTTVEVSLWVWLSQGARNCHFSVLYWSDRASQVALVVKKPPASAGDGERLIGSPDWEDPLEEIPWRRAWQPTPVFFPGAFHGQRSLVGYSPWSCWIRHDLSDLAPTHINQTSPHFAEQRKP